MKKTQHKIPQTLMANVVSLFIGSYQEAELTDELYKEVFNQFCNYVE